MSILTDNLVDELITIGDRYTIGILRINIPNDDFFVSSRLPYIFPFRNIDYTNLMASRRSINLGLVSDILSAPITKIQGTTHRYAHIKRCIKKHVNFESYHCVWDTSYAYGPSWAEPRTVHVCCNCRIEGKWVELIRVGLSLRDYQNEPF